jgi:hypothetical protein
VIGGVINQGVPPGEQFKQTTPTGMIETYDPTTGMWTTRQSMNKPVGYPSAVAVEDKIYVFGGGLSLFFTVAGVVVAASIVVALGVLVYQHRRKKTVKQT